MSNLLVLVEWWDGVEGVGLIQLGINKSKECSASSELSNEISLTRHPLTGMSFTRQLVTSLSFAGQPLEEPCTCGHPVIVEVWTRESVTGLVLTIHPVRVEGTLDSDVT